MVGVGVPLEAEKVNDRGDELVISLSSDCVGYLSVCQCQCWFSWDKRIDVICAMGDG